MLSAQREWWAPECTSFGLAGSVCCGGYVNQNPNQNPNSSKKVFFMRYVIMFIVGIVAFQSYDTAGGHGESTGVMMEVVRGTALRKRGKYAEALKSLNGTIERYPNCSYAYCQRAFVYQQSDWDESGEKAYRDADRAIQLDSTNHLSFILRGSALSDQERYQPAIADFTKAIELKSDSCSAYSNRAFAYLWCGKTLPGRITARFEISVAGRSTQDPPIPFAEASVAGLDPRSIGTHRFV